MTQNADTSQEKATPARTPGEWKSELTGTMSGQWLVIYVEDEGWDGGKRELFESETVRTVYGNRNTLNPRFRDTANAAEIRANVALAKAAPGMLASLHRSAQEHLDMAALLDAQRRRADQCRKYAADALAAIAKAEKP